MTPDYRDISAQKARRGARNHHVYHGPGHGHGANPGHSDGHYHQVLARTDSLALSTRLRDKHLPPERRRAHTSLGPHLRLLVRSQRLELLSLPVYLVVEPTAQSTNLDSSRADICLSRAILPGPNCHSDCFDTADILLSFVRTLPLSCTDSGQYAPLRTDTSSQKLRTQRHPTTTPDISLSVHIPSPARTNPLLSDRGHRRERSPNHHRRPGPISSHGMGRPSRRLQRSAEHHLWQQQHRLSNPEQLHHTPFLALLTDTSRRHRRRRNRLRSLPGPRGHRSFYVLEKREAPHDGQG